MSSRSQKPHPPGGSSSRSTSKDSQKKLPTTRKASADKGVPAARGGAHSLPSSPHNPKLASGHSSKKTAFSKVAKALQKDQAVAQVPVDDHVDIEVPATVEEEERLAFKRLPKGVETGQFTRRAPTEVKPVAFRPELSPRSQRVHNAACNFLNVKRKEVNDQKKMETFIMEMFPQLQHKLQKVHEMSQGAARFRTQPPEGDEEAIRQQNDKLNADIARASTLFKEFDGLLVKTRNRVLEFINSAEQGTSGIDVALRSVIDEICNYSKKVKDDDRPEGSLGGDQGGRPDDGDDPGDDHDDKQGGGGDQGHGSGGKPGDGSDGKSGDGSGGKPGEPDGKSGDGSGGKPGGGSDGKSGDGSGGKPGGGSDGKSGDGSGGKPGEPDGKSGDGSRGGQGDGSRGGQGNGSGDGQGDESGDNQSKPEGSGDGKKTVDDLGDECDYNSMLSPSASESEPEFEEDIHKCSDESVRDMMKTIIPVFKTVEEGVRSITKHPERIPQVHKRVVGVAESSSEDFKDIYKSGTPSKLLECFSGLDRVDPVAAMDHIVGKFIGVVEYLGSNTAESQVEGIDGLMDMVAANLEEVKKESVSSDAKR